jgi:hypothetical protein
LPFLLSCLGHAVVRWMDGARLSIGTACPRDKRGDFRLSNGMGLNKDKGREDVRHI